MQPAIDESEDKKPVCLPPLTSFPQTHLLPKSADNDSYGQKDLKEAGGSQHQILQMPQMQQQQQQRFGVLDYIDRVREDVVYLEMTGDRLAREKSEYERQYVKHWEMAFQLNEEVRKQLDINIRYQAIINQLLPMLDNYVQTCVQKDMDSIQVLADAPNQNPQQQAPPIAVVERDEHISPPPHANANGSYMDNDLKRTRGRPSKARLEKLKEDQYGSKRSRVENSPEESQISSTNGSARYTPQPYQDQALQSTNQGVYTNSFPRRGSINVPTPSTQQRTIPTAIPHNEAGKSSFPQGVRNLAALPHGEVVCAIAMSYPFRFIYTGGRGSVKVWDVSSVRQNRSGTLVGSLECLDNYIRALHVTKDSKVMIVAGEARFMVVCDITTSTPTIIGRLQTPNLLTYALNTSRDSQNLFSCCSDGSVNMWDLRTLQMVKSFVGHDDSVTCCCLTPDGQKLITGSLDMTVRVWDIIEGLEHCKYSFAAQIFSLGVCPKDPIIAVGLESSVVDVRYLSNFDLNQELNLHDSCVLGLKYSPNGNWFLTSGKDHKWIAWRATNCETLFQQLENASILSCDISRDGNFVVTGSGENNAHVYEVIY